MSASIVTREFHDRISKLFKEADRARQDTPKRQAVRHVYGADFAAGAVAANRLAAGMINVGDIVVGGVIDGAAAANQVHIHAGNGNNYRQAFADAIQQVQGAMHQQNPMYAQLLGADPANDHRQPLVAEAPGWGYVAGNMNGEVADFGRVEMENVRWEDLRGVVGVEGHLPQRHAPPVAPPIPENQQQLVRENPFRIRLTERLRGLLGG